MGKREENTKTYIESIIGKKFTTTEGYTVEIIGRPSPRNIEVIFEDGHTVVARLQAIEKGNIKNVFHKSIFSTGFVGLGKYVPKIKGRHTPAYIKWHGLMQRCYDPNYYIKKPSYKDCSVAEEWHNFQNFAKWYYGNWKSEYMDSNWHIDKDILVKGNKIYSPETCCFVHNKINTLFTKSNSTRGKYPIGVSKKGSKYKASIRKDNIKYNIRGFDTPEEAFLTYKKEKEEYIKEVADKWRNQIEPRVHEAMYNYEVEIID